MKRLCLMVATLSLLAQGASAQDLWSRSEEIKPGPCMPLEAAIPPRDQHYADLFGDEDLKKKQVYTVLRRWFDVTDKCRRPMFAVLRMITIEEFRKERAK